jgi:hypothetical protein
LSLNLLKSGLKKESSSKRANFKNKSVEFRISKESSKPERVVAVKGDSVSQSSSVKSSSNSSLRKQNQLHQQANRVPIGTIFKFKQIQNVETQASPTSSAISQNRMHVVYNYGSPDSFKHSRPKAQYSFTKYGKEKQQASAEALKAEVSESSSIPFSVEDDDYFAQINSNILKKNKRLNSNNESANSSRSCTQQNIIQIQNIPPVTILSTDELKFRITTQEDFKMLIENLKETFIDAINDDELDSMKKNKEDLPKKELLNGFNAYANTNGSLIEESPLFRSKNFEIQAEYQL